MESDVQQRNHVVVIGSEGKSKLFSGMFALGQTIRLNGISFEVVGVMKPKMQESGDNVNRISYIPFSTMGDIKDTKYLDGIWFNYRGEPKAVEHALRNTLAAAHSFRPTDHNAIWVANIMERLAQFCCLSER
jgi:putative ABC transport system permease protein